MDPLDAALATVRVEGAMVGRSLVEPPWALALESAEPCVLAAMVNGDGWVRHGEGEPRRLHAGCVAMACGSRPLVVSDDPRTKPRVIIRGADQCVDTATGDSALDRDRTGVRTWGPWDAPVSVLFGAYRTDGALYELLARGLPELVILGPDPGVSSVLSAVVLETDVDRPGQQVVVDRLMELLLFATVRAWTTVPQELPPTWARALSDPFVAVIPPHAVDPHPSHWLSMEMVLVAADGSWFHRGGEPGVYQRRLADAGSSVPWSGRVGDIACGPDGVHCVAVEGDLAALMASEKGALALVLVAAALISAYASGRAARLIARHWSFEARFRRHLDAGSIVCAYQPVMRLDSGEIAGCEVLARWRDIDDSIVFPDRFIDIVERHGMTLRLTQLVAQRACEELSRTVPPDRRLQVSFNVFPRDLDCARLLRVFSGFVAQPDRFDLVLEIIESDEMPANAQGEIEALRRAGVRTYIDDFGTGYSNMQNLAALSVDGVKLDRAFAMAPDNSMMAQMLRHAVEMIQATGRVMVVEGVETAERLALLRSMQARIDLVQGYHIARPLDIAAFAAFLKPGAAAHLAGEGIGALQARLRDRIQGGQIAV